MDLASLLLSARWLLRYFILTTPFYYFKYAANLLTKHAQKHFSPSSLLCKFVISES